MLRYNVYFVAIACVCATAIAFPSYGHHHSPGYSAPPRVVVAPSYAVAPAVVRQADTAEAQASALTEAAGAKASAAKLDRANWHALDRYGHEIGVPLLVRPYGELTNLYAAALPPRSFVGKIDPAFVKGSYGGIKHVSESLIGVAAI